MGCLTKYADLLFDQLTIAEASRIDDSVKCLTRFFNSMDDFIMTSPND